MASNNGRETYNLGETKKATKPKEVKTNLNLNKETNWGSGEYDDVYGGHNYGYRKRRSFPDIKRLENHVLKYIIGQDEQVRRIITAIYRAIKFKSIKTNILVIGSSGTGKTETIKQIAKRLHMPYTIEDANEYTQVGYYGANVKDMIYNLLDNANQDIKLAQQGIIVIDEIDKKVSRDDQDISGTRVLKSLLKIIEGTTLKIPSLVDPFDGSMVMDYDTKNNIVIFLGAFPGLEKIREKRLNKNPLGFSATHEEIENKQKRYLKSDLVEYGMPEEFVGRIDTIIEMNKLNKQDLALILKKSKLSIFRKYQAELRQEGITLSYSGKLFEAIAEESLALDTGARELSNTVNYIFENITYDVLADPNKYKLCTLDLDIVHDNTKYKLS